MQRRQRNLHPEANDEKRERRITPGRSGQRRHDVANLHTAARLACRKQHEGDQKEGLAKQRERHIDVAGALGRGVFVLRDQVIGRNADERINEIEGQQVRGNENAETAGQRQQPADRETRRIGLAAHIRNGENSSEDPNQRGGGKQHCARRIEPKAHAQRRLLERETPASDRKNSGRKRGQRSQRRERQRITTQLWRETSSQDDDRPSDRGGEQAGTKVLGCHSHRIHRSAAIAAGRPICKKAKKAGGAKASRMATSARDNATTSRLR